MNTPRRDCNSSDSLPISLLNDLLYCERRAALKAIEGWRGENDHTLLASSDIPPATLKPQCDGCSLRDICLPELAALRPSNLFTAEPSPT